MHYDFRELNIQLDGQLWKFVKEAAKAKGQVCLEQAADTPAETPELQYERNRLLEFRNAFNDLVSYVENEIKLQKPTD
jgi:hypothetical protein